MADRIFTGLASSVVSYRLIAICFNSCCKKILYGLQLFENSIWFVMTGLTNLKLVGDLWDWVLGAACFTAAVAERAAQRKAKGAPPLHLVTPFALREHIHCVTRQRAIVESFRQNIQRPDDSKWPFDSLVGGHQQPLKGSLNHPKKVTSRIARGIVVELDSWLSEVAWTPPD